MSADPIFGGPAHRGRAGAVLLEAVVALAILGGAVVTLTSLGTASAVALRRAAMSAEDARRASAFLDAVSLWSVDDLDRRLGNREQGEWRLHITREYPSLYAVELTDASGGQVLLRTVLYRPPPAEDRRDGE
jgi:hypothetical protein